MTRLLIGLGVICLAGVALAQTPAPLSDSARRVIGSWEFSNADRDRTCTATLKSDLSPAASRSSSTPTASIFSRWCAISRRGSFRKTICSTSPMRAARRSWSSAKSKMESSKRRRPELASCFCRMRRPPARPKTAGATRRRLGDRAQVRSAGLYADACDGKGQRRFCRCGKARLRLRPLPASILRNGASIATS